MRRLALLFSFALIAAPAWALNTNDLVSTIAMPLAVAAVSNTTGVSPERLATLVTALNEGNVAPTRFVEVVRYVPVALVPDNQPLDLTQYVQNEVSNGVTGDALVNAVVQQLEANYGVTPQLELPAPATTVVVQPDYVPREVITQLSGVTPNDLLTAVVIPLAVAQVSNIDGVSPNELADLVTTLNNANVPPVQVVEVLRYVPVALVSDNAPQFVQFVQQQASQGISGPALTPVVVQQLQTYYPPQTRITVQPQAARPVEVDEHFVPPMAMSQVTQMRMHPHGGPPGQIKREIGVRTGAQVVHGGMPGHAPHMRNVPPPMMSSTPAPVPAHTRRAPAARPIQAPMPHPIPMHGAGHGPPPNRGGNGHGHGHGHGHGKD